ncbi:SPFH domain-containing protein [Kamptonema formosum]|uniref:SPFH domain-containing protein n=1 Tax=Kamptonema formosum TaxID=331992 RepID=UPI001E3C6301|nr:stomatin-like protein [Oscillatoria sp. PCC 10802]
MKPNLTAETLRLRLLPRCCTKLELHPQVSPQYSRRSLIMEPLLAVIVPLAVMIGCAVRSVKIVTQSNEALVERLGKYHRTLEPGLQFINPFIDMVVLEDTMAERVLEIQPQQAITKDKVALTADAIVYWRVIDLEKAYYNVEDIEEALTNLVLTTLRSEIGTLELEETFASRKKINKALLKELDEETERWGVKVTRVEVQEIKPAAAVLEAIELERAAQSKKKAAIYEAEGTVEAMQLLSEALESHPNSREVLQFLVAQRYVDASHKLGESNNAKIVFLGSEPLTQSVAELVGDSGHSSPNAGAQNRSVPAEAPKNGSG